MTATANQQDRKYIMESLGLKECQNVVGNLNRKNIFYKKVFRQGKDLDAFEGILRPVATNLLENKIQHRLTIIYLPLKWCGVVLPINSLNQCWVVYNITHQDHCKFQRTDYLPNFMLPKISK